MSQDNFCICATLPHRHDCPAATLPDAKATGDVINEATKLYIQTMSNDPELKPWTNGLPNFHAEGFKAAIRFAEAAGAAREREKANAQAELAAKAIEAARRINFYRCSDAGPFSVNDDGNLLSLAEAIGDYDASALARDSSGEGKHDART